MITDAFDKSEVLFGPKDFYGEKKNLCDKCVIIFSEVIFEYMLETYEHEQAGIIRCCNGVTAVYVFEIDEMKIAGYLSHIGSALAGSDVIDANWLTGADKFIMFGSAGSLDCNATDGKFVIPTAAYREEGLSYHYSAPTDYVEIKNAKAVKAIFDELNLPSVTGKVWTRNGVTYNLEKMMSDIHRQEPSVSLGSLMYVAYAFEIGGLKSIFFCFLSNGR